MPNVRGIVIIRRVIVLGMLAGSAVARAEATQSGSPPQLDPGLEASVAGDGSQVTSSTQQLQARPAEAPQARGMAEPKEESPRSRYQRFNDGEGERK